MYRGRGVHQADEAAQDPPPLPECPSCVAVVRVSGAKWRVLGDFFSRDDFYDANPDPEPSKTGAPGGVWGFGRRLLQGQADAAAADASAADAVPGEAAATASAASTGEENVDSPSSSSSSSSGGVAVAVGVRVGSGVPVKVAVGVGKKSGVFVGGMTGNAVGVARGVGVASRVG